MKKRIIIMSLLAGGMLLLGYGNERDYEETRKALAEQGATYATATQGALKVIAKPRVGKPKKRA